MVDTPKEDNQQVNIPKEDNRQVDTLKEDNLHVVDMLQAADTLLEVDNLQEDILRRVDTRLVGRQLGDSLLVVDTLLLLPGMEGDRVVLMDNNGFLLNVKIVLSH